MGSSSLESHLKKLFKKYKFQTNKKYKLLIILGLLGDFDSFEYAINLKNFSKDFPNKDLDILAIAIGNKTGKEKFCNFTGFPKSNLNVVSDNKIHKTLEASSGIDIGLGGWMNMLMMLSGINSHKTIKEVIRGYTGDREAKQIFSEFDQINFLKFIKFSGNSFKKVFGDGYLRPFELATFRLQNMIHIIQNWDDYILHSRYLPQRGATFILNNENEIIYKYISKDVLGYSSKMSDPLLFLKKVCE